MGLIKRIFGRGKQREQESILSSADKIVNDYGDFMQSPAFPAPGCVADTKKLPYDKQTIKNALILSIKLCDDPKMKEMLKVAYMGLADFQDGVGETDVGLDMRNLPNPEDVDFNDTASFEAIAKQMDSMMGSYEEFKPMVEEERRFLKKDLAQL